MYHVPAINTPSPSKRKRSAQSKTATPKKNSNTLPTEQSTKAKITNPQLNIPAKKQLIPEIGESSNSKKTTKEHRDTQPIPGIVLDVVAKFENTKEKKSEADKSIFSISDDEEDSNNSLEPPNKIPKDDSEQSESNLVIDETEKEISATEAGNDAIFKNPTAIAIKNKLTSEAGLPDDQNIHKIESAATSNHSQR